MTGRLDDSTTSSGSGSSPGRAMIRISTWRSGCASTPRKRAAAWERSRQNFFAYGPRSLTRSRSLRPVARDFTSIHVPRGRVRWAAEYLRVAVDLAIRGLAAVEERRVVAGQARYAMLYGHSGIAKQALQERIGGGCIGDRRTRELIAAGRGAAGSARPARRSVPARTGAARRKAAKARGVAAFHDCRIVAQITNEPICSSGWRVTLMSAQQFALVSVLQISVDDRRGRPMPQLKTKEAVSGTLSRSLRSLAVTPGSAKSVTRRRLRRLKKKYTTWALGASLAIGGIGTPLAMVHEVKGPAVRQTIAGVPATDSASRKISGGALDRAGRSPAAWRRSRRVSRRRPVRRCERSPRLRRN